MIPIDRPPRPRARRKLRALAMRAGLALAGLAASSTAIAKLELWAIDPVHTRIVFEVDHAGFSTSRGTFAEAKGTLQFDPDASDFGDVEVDVTVPLCSLEIGDAGWRRAIRGRNYLRADDHPQARFTSKKVRFADVAEPAPAAGGERRFQLIGELEVAGHRQPLVLEVTVNRIGRHPVSFRRTAGFSATATVDRTAFGMTAHRRSVGQSVLLRIELEAQAK